MEAIGAEETGKEWWEEETGSAGGGRGDVPRTTTPPLRLSLAVAFPALLPPLSALRPVSAALEG